MYAGFACRASFVSSASYDHAPSSEGVSTRIRKSAMPRQPSPTNAAW